MFSPKGQRICGWSAVVISTFIGGFWGFWGSIEDFRWYFTSLPSNLVLLVGQYLSPMIVVAGLSAVGVCWRLAALPIFGTIAIALAFFFRGAAPALILIVIPLLCLGGLYFFGDPQPRRWALGAVIGLPFCSTALLTHHGSRRPKTAWRLHAVADRVTLPGLECIMEIAA